MFYTSTRSAVKVTASEAIVNGISTDGGLYVPSSFPILSPEDIAAFKDLSYPERAASILQKFLDGFSYEELLEYSTAAYSRFDGDPAPVAKIDDNTFILELWHGPTAAFKDLALTLLPYLIMASRKKTGEKNKTLILVATSGDTGKAALEGFKDVTDTEIIVFYPDEGVSYMQKLQMVTQEGGNVHVCAIKGNFDDAQSAVKTIFTDKKMIEKIAEKGYSLSSANSINWGRLVPQIVYYFSAYADLIEAEEIKPGDKINFCVPCGNFGNILAGYYAKLMGLPVDTFICASNKNNILTDFFNTGVYDTNREFYKTQSPSMDILISSNLERFIYELSGRDNKFVAEKMAELKTSGKFSVDVKLLKNCGIVAGYADEEETSEAIGNFFEVNDYPLDPHTAVAASVYADYATQAEDNTTTVIVSTASPYKFPSAVYYAISDFFIEDPFKAAKKLQFDSAMDIPECILNIKSKTVRHTEVVDRKDIGEAVLGFIDKE